MGSDPPSPGWSLAAAGDHHIVDQMARLCRAGKQALAEGLGPILDRLGLTEGREKLTDLMDRLRSGETRLGYAIAVQ